MVLLSLSKAQKLRHLEAVAPNSPKLLGKDTLLANTNFSIS